MGCSDYRVHLINLVHYNNNLIIRICISLSPEGRTFRSRQDIRQYLVLHQLSYDLELFDFRLGEEFYRERGIEPPKRAKDDYVAPALQKQHLKNEQSLPGQSSDLESPTFVPENDGYRCPLEDCRKLFRRDNLLLVMFKKCFFFLGVI